MGKGGARLGKSVKGSGPLFHPNNVPRRSNDDEIRQQTFSSRLRAWFNNDGAKFVAGNQMKHDAMSAMIRIETLQGRRPAATTFRYRSLFRRQRRTELLFNGLEQRNQSQTKLALSEKQAEQRLGQLDSFGQVSVQAFRSYSSGIGRLGKVYMAHQHEMEKEIGERLEQVVMAGDRELEEATELDEGIEGPADAHFELEQQLTSSTGEFADKRHRLFVANENTLEAMQSILKARIADLESATETERELQRKQCNTDIQSYKALVRSDRALILKVATNSKSITKIRQRFLEMRLVNEHFRRVELSQNDMFRENTRMVARMAHGLQRTVEHWRQTCDTRLKDLSMIAFQERTKLKGVVNKAARILRRLSIVKKIERDVNDIDPETPLQKRIAERALELHRLRANLEYLTKDNDRLVLLLSQMAIRSGMSLDRLIQPRKLTVMVPPVPSRRTLSRSQSSII